jgi:hypothetical protein
MARRVHVLGVWVGLCAGVAACAGTPPTATPGAAPTVAVAAPGSGQQAGTTIELTVPPPPSPPPVTPQPITIGKLVPYTEPNGRFSITVPEGWTASSNTLSPTSDVKLSMAWQPPETNGLVTVTHFDNGKTPVSFGATVNGLLKQTGLTERPGYVELAREQVPDRKGDAMRIELEYRRSNGVPTHSLILFELDGSVFSMVHAGVESGSWKANDMQVREILRSYRVLAGAAPTQAK